MKKLIIIMAHAAICYNCFAQSPNRSSSLLDKFVGTWIYNKNGKVVKIVLKEVQVKVPFKDVTTTMIEGYHVYKNNNKIIDGQQGNETTLTSGYIPDRNEPNKVKITVSDIAKDKTADAFLTYISGDTIKLKCVLINKEGVRLRKKDGTSFDPHFTLPESIIFYKQN